MSAQTRRDWVAKNMKKFHHGEAHKSKKDYKRKQKGELKHEALQEVL